jgi:hypothetical protein
MPYTWINEPPVVEVANMSEVEALCKQFVFEVRKSERPPTEERYIWEDRKWWAERAANNLMFAVASNPGSTSRYIYCVYKHAGKPVGLMEWWKGLDQGIVEHLAMLPGRENECAILVEHAVNLSAKVGYEGRVYFSGLNFAEQPHSPPGLQSNVFVPSKSDEWVWLGDKWRFKDHLLNDWRRLIIGRETFGRIYPQPYRF